MGHHRRRRHDDQRHGNHNKVDDGRSLRRDRKNRRSEPLHRDRRGRHGNRRQRLLQSPLSGRDDHASEQSESHRDRSLQQLLSACLRLHPGRRDRHRRIRIRKLLCPEAYHDPRIGEADRALHLFLLLWSAKRDSGRRRHLRRSRGILPLYRHGGHHAPRHADVHRFRCVLFLQSADRDRHTRKRKKDQPGNFLRL